MIPWWTDQEAGLFGGIAGSVVGILGGVLGTVAGILAPRGRGKSFVYGLSIFMFCAGILSLIVGVVALSQGQPYGVYYPLLLMGFIGTLALGTVFPVIRKRYQEADNRRLEAEEFRRS
jgi:ABC-type transport system involved in cytochrome c biogenesis permease subunit